MDSNNYIPDYAKGEILVGFYDMPEPSRDFPELVGNMLGFKLISMVENCEAYIYQTEIGKEDEACKIFMEKGLYVDYADKIDLNLEKKWNGLEEAVKNIENLSNSVEKYPSSEFNGKIDLIKKLLNSIKY